ncbi:hypothetical protein F5888DRAFT_1802366 [Russula emetica]|nr:hypothetical protein F5888DRAFT_1802366 [Russula emetica]
MNPAFSPAVPLTVANITVILTNIPTLFTTVTVFQSLLFAIFPYEPRIQSGISALKSPKHLLTSPKYSPTSPTSHTSLLSPK